MTGGRTGPLRKREVFPVPVSTRHLPCKAGRQDRYSILALLHEDIAY